ncbi:helix-turn-helix domain-containing protein [Amycolatopsis umgeniensis]|uniref:helix-turn-helix domain-containing protein n=1 Tax=Amycolatopsis umgeniensis TaxID=336628 RepID=UPI001608F308|nr:helix-turn-helix domain-containing protein [Amycolatopsis umgeniensis]
METKKRPRSVLVGAFTLLDALIRHQGEAGLTQLANSCSLPKATAHRLLEQLTELEVVQRSENRYRVGAQAFRLGQSWQPYPRLLELARGRLRELAAATRASSVLAVPCDGRILIAAASLIRPEHDLLLRPGSTVPQRIGRFSPVWQAEHGLVVAEASVRLPTGGTVGSIATVIAVPRSPGAVSDAVARTARTLSAALVNQSATDDRDRRNSILSRQGGSNP